MAKVLHVNIQDLSVSTTKGSPIPEALTLGTVFTLTQLNGLAEKYLGGKFEKGTKKSEACEQLFAAMTKALEGNDKKPAAEKAVAEKPAAKSKKEPRVVGFLNPDPDGTGPLQEGEGAVTLDENKAEKPAKPVKATKEPKEKKAKTYKFNCLGAQELATLTYQEKPLMPQCAAIIKIMFTGVRKGTVIEKTKEEIIAALQAGNYPCKGDIWANFMWYRGVLKALKVME